MGNHWDALDHHRLGICKAANSAKTIGLLIPFHAVDRNGLLRNGLPPDTTKELENRIVAANYHPGSLCRLPDGYGVQCGLGGKWPVKAVDSVVVSFGAEALRYA